jgi:hypothetical protein
MPKRERIVKIDDGQDKAGEFSQSRHERDCQRCALGCEHKYRANAHILGQGVANQIDPYERHGK